MYFFNFVSWCIGFLFIDIEILVPAIILFCFTFLLTFFVFLLV